MALLLLMLFLAGFLGTSYSGPEYDFEVPNQEIIFKATASSFVRSQKFYKNGDYSLLWHWPARDENGSPSKLEILLGDNSLKIEEKELQKGGIKFWMYHEKESSGLTMNIIFHGEARSSTTATKTSPTTVNLNFKGWRAVWIGYEEFGSEIAPLTTINKVEFMISTTQSDKLYFDLVRFVPSMKKQSRDSVVMRVGQSSRSSDTLFYDDKDFWQQSLRWYAAGKPRNTPPVPDADTKIKEIEVIEDKLENWYAKVGETLKTLTKVDDFAIDMAMDPPGGIDFVVLKQKRWKKLQADIELAYLYYSKIDFLRNRPTLFPKVSEFGEEGISDDPHGMTNFGFIFARVLLPLSLEYNFMSRVTEVTALGNRLCTRLKSTDYVTVVRAVETITGQNHEMFNEFMTNVLQPNKQKLNCASNKQPTEVNGADLINIFNENIRLARILALLDFLENQGWAEGSGLGTLDHEMNKAGSGFMHSMFLLRKALRRPKHKDRLNRLIKTMNWYNDFNEIYQPEADYVYDGTTADRCRTTLLYRLIIILITPSQNNKEKKINDLIHYQRWFRHALKINKGLGGVIKPDFVGFHHKTFYGSAYVPHALHNAAFVQYLLEGTSFKLDTTSKHNLREALRVLRMIAVKYSTPNSIGGRFPGYNRAVLAEHFPAYAYISYQNETKEIADRPAMFLRLFNHKEPSARDYLEDGHIKSGIYYWNTIGSLDVLQKISTLKCSKECQVEPSPIGHWSKNFAGLSIHRRKDWSVAAKGFNRYTWDYESSQKENTFGVFASHGSLQISNSEGALKSYDVSDGWDWTRVPGATTVNAEIVNIVTGKARNYNPGQFAGGVSFIGSMGKEPRNGAFGMVFKEPTYEMKNKASPLNTMELEFRKSYFFYNDLIICLGSDIKFRNVDVTNYYAQTTLFQDKLVDPYKASSIRVDSNTHDLRLLLKRKKNWDVKQTVNLTDTHGNTYQVKNAGASGLNVEIKDQESFITDGCEKTKARYATAWFEHKNRQSTSSTSGAKSRSRKITKQRRKKKPKQRTTVKAKKMIATNKRQKNGTKNKDKPLKGKVNNEVYVNGINVDPNRKVDSNNEIVDAADDDSYLGGISDDSDGNVVDKPDHYEVTVDSIDKNNGDIGSDSEEKDNDVNDDHDDKEYYDEESEMDSHGTDVNYDDDSTSSDSNSNSMGNKIVSMMNNTQNESNMITDISTKSTEPIPLEDMDLAKNVESSSKMTKENENRRRGGETDEKGMLESTQNSANNTIDSVTEMDTYLHEAKDNSLAKEPQIHNNGQDQDDNMDTDTEKGSSKTNMLHIKANFTHHGEQELKHNSKTVEIKVDKVGEEEANNNIEKAFDNDQPIDIVNENSNNVSAKFQRKQLSTEEDTKSEAMDKDKMELTELMKDEDANTMRETNKMKSQRKQLNTEENAKSEATNKDKMGVTELMTDEDANTIRGTSKKKIKGKQLSTEENTKSVAMDKDKMETTELMKDEEANTMRETNKKKSQRKQFNTEEDIRSEATNKDKMDVTELMKDEDDNALREKKKKKSQGKQLNTEEDIRSEATNKDQMDVTELMKDEDDNAMRENNNKKSQRKQLNTEEDIRSEATNKDKMEVTELMTVEDANSRKNASKKNQKTNIDGEDDSNTETDEKKERNIQQNKVRGKNAQSKNNMETTDVPKGEEEKPMDSTKEKQQQAIIEKDNSNDIDPDKTSKDEKKETNKEEITEQGVNAQSEDNMETTDDAPEDEGDDQMDTDKEDQHQNDIRKQSSSDIVTDTKSKNEPKNMKIVNTQIKTNRALKTVPNRGKVEEGNLHIEEETDLDTSKTQDTDKDTVNTDVNTGKETRLGKNIRKKTKKKTMYKKLKKVMKNVKTQTNHATRTRVKHHDKQKVQMNKNMHNTFITHQQNRTDFDQQPDREIRDGGSRYKSEDVATDLSWYEYAILIKGGSPLLLGYTVIQQIGKVHAVEFGRLPDLKFQMNKVYAYSFFESLEQTESVRSGPVIRANAPCMMMAELGSTSLHLSVSNPAITFQDDPAVKDKDRCTRKGRKDIGNKFSPTNSDEVGEKMMFCVEGEKTAIRVSLRLDGNPKSKIPGLSGVKVNVNGQPVSNPAAYISLASPTEVIFLNLVNGFTTEVLLPFVQA